jgi:uncharacterized protein (TIGR03083 family)
MAEGPLRTAAEYRNAYRHEIESIEQLVAPLDESELRRETGCPGWTVHDIVAHVSALESIFIERELPAHQAPDASHVRNSFGAFMENGVDYRRSWSKDRLLEEYREVTAERLRRLDSIRDEDLESEVKGLFSTGKLRNVLAIRIFDLWTHEQDIRRAIGRPGGFEGPAAQNSRDRMMRGFAQRLLERGVAPDGTSLVVEFGDPLEVRRGIVFADGRSRVVDDVETPSLTLRADCTTWTVLACGRADLPDATSRVSVEGDADLGRTLLTDLAITP